MMIQDGVVIAGIRPEIVLALVVAWVIFSTFGERLVITSVVDGEHMRASLHYVGAAADIALPVEHLRDIMDALYDALGLNYDVVLEHDHIHIEFQPKGGLN